MLDEIKKLERRTYLKYVAGILIGIIPFLIFWKTKGSLATVFIIAGGFLIIISFIALSASFDFYYKLKGRLREQETGEEFRETYIDWPPWVKNWGGLLYLIIIMFGVGLGGGMHENDFGGTRFVWHSLIAGVLIGLLLFYTLRLIYTNWTSNRKKAAEIAFYFVITSVFVTVCAGPLVNKVFAVAEIKCDNYSLKRITRKYKDDKSYIHVKTGRGDERFKPHRSFYNQLNETDSVITLCVRKGALGYEYVEEFRKPASIH
ncbi:MAG TPA: hypothetical protein VF476_15940 [Chitinophagaceae bacterium]